MRRTRQRTVQRGISRITTESHLAKQIPRRQTVVGDKSKLILSFGLSLSLFHPPLFLIRGRSLLSACPHPPVPSQTFAVVAQQQHDSSESSSCDYRPCPADVGTSQSKGSGSLGPSRPVVSQLHRPASRPADVSPSGEMRHFAHFAIYLPPFISAQRATATTVATPFFCTPGFHPLISVIQACLSLPVSRLLCWLRPSSVPRRECVSVCLQRCSNRSSRSLCVNDLAIKPNLTPPHTPGPSENRANSPKPLPRTIRLFALTSLRSTR